MPELEEATVQTDHPDCDAYKGIYFHEVASYYCETRDKDNISNLSAAEKVDLFDASIEYKDKYGIFLPKCIPKEKDDDPYEKPEKPDLEKPPEPGTPGVTKIILLPGLTLVVPALPPLPDEEDDDDPDPVTIITNKVKTVVLNESPPPTKICIDLNEYDNNNPTYIFKVINVPEQRHFPHTWYHPGIVMIKVFPGIHYISFTILPIYKLTAKEIIMLANRHYYVLQDLLGLYANFRHFHSLQVG